MNTNADIVVIDCESSGLDPLLDRITQIAIHRVGYGVEKSFLSYVNPERSIPKEVQELTGITDEVVANAPKFKDIANGILALLTDPEEHQSVPYIVAYNGFRFDIPLLYEEFRRAGIDWKVDLSHIIDPGEIFKIKEARTLTAAVKFYCKREMEGAHDAMNDVKATLDVLYAQVDRYDDLKGKTLEEIASASRKHHTLDVHGRIGIDADGDAIFLFGKPKGTKIKDDLGFARWILGKDFSEDTKRVVSEAMEKAYREQKADTKQGGLF